MPDFFSNGPDALKKEWRDRLAHDTTCLKNLNAINDNYMKDEKDNINKWLNAASKLSWRIITYTRTDGFSYKEINSTFNEIEDYINDQMHTVRMYDEDQYCKLLQSNINTHRDIDNICDELLKRTIRR